MAEPRPKLLTRRQSIFREDTMTNPAGEVIRVRRVKTTAGVHFTVSVNGKRVDSALTHGRAMGKARQLFNTKGALDEAAQWGRDRRNRHRNGVDRRGSAVRQLRKTTSGKTYHYRGGLLIGGKPSGRGWFDDERTAIDPRRIGLTDRRKAL